ncbi:hypothetical protein BDV95DRAFT_607120 [Massariosphaeria phaeospora]|uniref:Rhodopsin domain-containing protein n=1 Tax=Massariosphaeria phaeospora TaxID=100035 RepID=A0A7C8MC16_9PLEO|nr:hypothetical protein BDV95DRAFT_607120 [Massariosphaeria phaeospora]
MGCNNGAFASYIRRTNLVAVTYYPPALLAKLALLLQIKRIFCIAERNFVFWASWILIVANVVTHITIFFVQIYPCYPREKVFNPALPGKCLSLPVYSIWNLQMPLKRKIGVASMFATGTISDAACVLRGISTLRSMRARYGDLLFSLQMSSNWGVVEATAIILCPCFMTFLVFSPSEELGPYMTLDEQTLRPESGQAKTGSQEALAKADKMLDVRTTESGTISTR